MSKDTIIDLPDGSACLADEIKGVRVSHERENYNVVVKIGIAHHCMKQPGPVTAYQKRDSLIEAWKQALSSDEPEAKPEPVPYAKAPPPDPTCYYNIMTDPFRYSVRILVGTQALELNPDAADTFANRVRAAANDLRSRRPS
jgi:hypothetical protein